MSEVLFGIVEAEGKGECSGGSAPDPPIDDFPLLVWDGHEVKLEDGRATVWQIASVSLSSASLANRLGTTEDHINQARAYLSRAGLAK
jgi:hypothetical protein